MPASWGRVVAGVEALLGVFLVALLIGKLASERQSALLLLIYTSDQQRRLSGFAAELQHYAGTFDSSQALDLEAVERCAAFIASFRAYLMFQTHQGRLADFGNGSALRQLYRSMYKLLSSIEDLLARVVLEPRVEERLLRVANRVARLATIMEPFHEDDGTATSTLAAVGTTMKRIRDWESSAVTARRLEQVLAVVPPKPWPKHFHKAASVQLGISATLFRKCMNKLMESGRL